MPNGVLFGHLNPIPTAIPFTIGQLGVACHSPRTSGPGILNCAGDDPSLARKAIMAKAAASPVAMPSVLAWPSGIDARELARSASSVEAWAGKVLSPRYAAWMAGA